MSSFYPSVGSTLIAMSVSKASTISNDMDFADRYTYDQ